MDGVSKGPQSRRASVEPGRKSILSEREEGTGRETREEENRGTLLGQR